MKNVKLNYSKLSNESLDDWLEREGLEIIIGGHEPDGFRVYLKFKDPTLQIASPGHILWCYYRFSIADPVNDITENGLKKILRNKVFVKVRYYKKEVKIKNFFRNKTIQKTEREDTEITTPNFIVE